MKCHNPHLLIHINIIKNDAKNIEISYKSIKMLPNQNPIRLFGVVARILTIKDQDVNRMQPGHHQSTIHVFGNSYKNHKNVAKPNALKRNHKKCCRDIW